LRLPKFLRHNVNIWLVPYQYTEKLTIRGFFGDAWIRVRPFIPSIRYYKHYMSQGNTVPDNTYQVQNIAIYRDYVRGFTNLASGKTVTGSSTGTNLANAVDASDTTYAQFNTTASEAWIQVDLGSQQDLSYTQILHYTADGRKFNKHRTEVSPDGVKWWKIQDSVWTGVYKEVINTTHHGDGWRELPIFTQTIDILNNKCRIFISDLRVIHGSDKLIYIDNSEAVQLSYIYCKGQLGTGKTTYGIACYNSTVTVEFSQIDYCNDKAIYAGLNSLVYAVHNKGGECAYGLYAEQGGQIVGEGYCPTGNNANTGSWLGTVITGNATYSAGDYTYDVPPAPPTQTYTRQFQASGSGCWRGYWDTDKVAQGDWGYGNNEGCWFFGDVKSVIAGSTIKSARLYITRNNGGGYSAARTVRLGVHAYTSRPAGDPVIDMTVTATASLAWGQSAWIDVTALVQRMQSTSNQGIGCYISSNLSNDYMTFSTSATLEVTYEK
jgi:hypothetical protein